MLISIYSSLFGLVLLFSVSAKTETQKSPHWVFCCQPNNDLYQILSGSGIKYPRYETPQMAIDNAPKGSGVLLLADGYPEQRVEIDARLYQSAQQKKLRLYVEYPSYIPDIQLGKVSYVKWERGVITSDFFAPNLKPMQIVGINECRYIPVSVPNAHITLATVAGYDRAVFGLPQSASPILFEHPNLKILVAATNLSQFVTARYGPLDAWKCIWQTILAWLDPTAPAVTLDWKPTVHPAYAADTELPPDVERQAIQRGAEWYVRAKLLFPTEREAEIAKRVEEGTTYSDGYAAGWMDFEAGPMPPPDSPVGNGKLGILEGFSSRILTDGSQPQKLIRRSDCTGVSAMGLAFGGIVNDSSEFKEDAKNLLDFIYFDSVAQQGVRADPKSPAFGLVAWGITNWAWERVFYGDDNAQLLLGSMATAALLQSDRWDEAILKCLLGNLRTTGRLGFRPDSILLPELLEKGCRYYTELDTVSLAPHYQSYLLACYLWAYRHTQYEPFLQKAEKAIRIMMEAYPHRWRWTNGIQQERARMLLPLSWLIRVQDTAVHREWLHRIAHDLLALQQECGALREAIGDIKQGTLIPPQSNDKYGSNESSLLQENGDPVSDMLYTTNFALLGLHEAAATVKEAYLNQAEDKLAKFLCRIQIRSEIHPELDGGWFRAFDFNRWEYWASNGDAGWGAWSIETGWTQGFVLGGLGLRNLKTSLWDLTANSQIGAHFSKYLPIFFPEDN